ncbi:zinc finger protein [Penicillium samsonianum]|uniref:zinc finger protein n=1 Tax=Penicillium samsonianum TaxID=1882272 RepID=UPI00254957D1|nr:zinc finger protein [Penicillium samsonianum]KAJ6138770.1 zinc finger protein [Penicillium samsonianum]
MLLPLKKEIDNYYIFSKVERTRSVKSTIYASVYKINGGKKHAAILVGNRRGAINNKPTREKTSGRGVIKLLRLEYNITAFRRVGPLGDDLNTSWEKGYTSSGKYIPNAEQIFVCFQCPKTYSDYNGVKRHFRTSHLTDRKCNFCDLSVLHEMHLRRHASDAHGLRI